MNNRTQTWKEKLVNKFPKFSKKFLLEIIMVISFFIFIIFNEFACNTKYFSCSNSGVKTEIKK